MRQKIEQGLLDQYTNLKPVPIQKDKMSDPDFYDQLESLLDKLSSPVKDDVIFEHLNLLKDKNVLDP